MINVRTGKPAHLTPAWLVWFWLVLAVITLADVAVRFTFGGDVDMARVALGCVQLYVWLLLGEKRSAQRAAYDLLGERSGWRTR